MLSIRAQLMLFIGAMTLLSLALVWGVITYALVPQYNRAISTPAWNTRSRVKAAALTAMIDQSSEPIASRNFGVLVLNNEFWQSVGDAFLNKQINVDGCCVDFSDATLRCLKAYESMYPCLLHESTGAFGGEFGYNVDTALVIQMRQKLFEKGALYQVVRAGSSQQMLVGRLSADGRYGVIVSTSLAQISTAAEVMRSILAPLALVLLVLDLIFAMLFSRWFTRPIERLSAGASRSRPATTTCRSRSNTATRSASWPTTSTTWPPRSRRSAQLEKDILANVSHDLRTPLTLIKGYAETVRDITGDDEPKRTEQCNIIVDETDRLSTLVNSVMELSKVQNGAEKPNRIDFDMSELCLRSPGATTPVRPEPLDAAPGSRLPGARARRPRHDGARAAQPVGQCVPPHWRRPAWWCCA